MELQMYGGMHYQLPYPPLELEDFPQINLTETETKAMKGEEMVNDCMVYRDCTTMSGTLEEIISLCSSQDNNSLHLSMLD